MSVVDSDVMLMTLTTDKRSVSPLTPSPSRKMRGIRLFRAISRKLTRKSQENVSEEDSRSSSTDSCSSTSQGSRCSRSRKLCTHNSSSSAESSGFWSAQQTSSSSSDAGSDVQTRTRHHHSSSAESIRKVFRNLSVSTRSQSCTNARDCKKKSSKKHAPKKILRSPVAYTYVKGLSGLPTQRVPRTLPRVYLNSSCGCTMQYMAGGLNR